MPLRPHGRMRKLRPARPSAAGPGTPPASWGRPNCRPVLVLLLPLAAIVAAVLSWGGRSGMVWPPNLGNTGPVYTVAAVREHLAHDARGWVRRTILVRGSLAPCMVVSSAGDVPCAAMVPGAWPLDLVDPDRPADVEPLPLMRGDSNQALALLRRLPVLQDLVPAAQDVHWEGVATYRVQLQAMAHGLCGAGDCYGAVLLDAAP